MLINSFPIILIFFSVPCAVGLICSVAGEICLLPHSHLQLVALCCGGFAARLEFDFIACSAAVFGLVSLICRGARSFCLINFYMHSSYCSAGPQADIDSNEDLDEAISANRFVAKTNRLRVRIKNLV